MAFQDSAAFVLVLGALGCRETSAPEPAEVPSAQPAVANPPITELEEPSSGPETVPESAESSFFAGYETRDHQLWLHSGAQTPRYTVKDKEGNVLAAGIDAARLARDYPDLHRLIDLDASRLIDIIDY